MGRGVVGRDAWLDLERWERYVVGGGALESSGAGLRFVLRGATRQAYGDAQIDDYQRLPRRRFRWRPPLRLQVRARFSHEGDVLRGTAGFGFWNDPFGMTGARLPTLPRAVWFFFASPPSDMRLDLETPGWGWKVAVLDALRPSALLLAPLAPLLVPLMNVRPIYRSLWPWVQSWLRIREWLVEVSMKDWHLYELVWREDGVDFAVDGRPLLCGAPSPRGPLGFVMWMDNQYLVATPQGRFRWGLLDVPGEQWMEVDRLRLTR